MPSQALGYAQFLSLLLSLGPKLQTLWPLIQGWIAATTALIGGIKGLIPEATATPAMPSPGVLAITNAMVDGVPVTAEVLDKESQVAALIAGPNAAFDGSILRGIFQFVQAHPESLTLLLTLLKGG